MTIPNALTVARLVLGLTAAGLFIAGSHESVAVWLCAAGVALDWLDGWLARRLGQQSDLGAFLDPLSDKIMMVVVYTVIAVQVGSPVVWFLFVMIVIRDSILTVYRYVDYQKKERSYPSDWSGKTKMGIQSVGGVTVLFDVYIVRGGPSVPTHAVVLLLVVVALLSYFSAGRYLREIRKRQREKTPVTTKRRDWPAHTTDSRRRV